MKTNSGVIKEKDLSFTSDRRCYMVQYKGQNIGGAGTLHKEGQSHPSNSAFHHSMGQLAVRDILLGKMAPYIRDNITKIQGDTK